METVVFHVQVELSANMKLLNAKNTELQSFIQRLNGNCSIIQVKILQVALVNSLLFNLQFNSTIMCTKGFRGQCRLIPSINP